MAIAYLQQSQPHAVNRQYYAATRGLHRLKGVVNLQAMGGCAASLEGTGILGAKEAFPSLRRLGHIRLVPHVVPHVVPLVWIGLYTTSKIREGRPDLHTNLSAKEKRFCGRVSVGQLLETPSVEVLGIWKLTQRPV